MASDLAKSMTEDQLLTAITEAATLYGWRWHHVRRSDKALQQGHPGFPDLVLARKGRVLFFELKSEKGQLTKAQAEWEDSLVFPTLYPGHAYMLVRPSDLDWALGLLKAP